MGVNKVKVEERKRKAWKLYSEGFSYREIGRELKVSHVQVMKYVKPFFDEWLDENGEEVKKKKERELLKLDAWEKRVTRAFNKQFPDKELQDKIAQEVSLKLKILTKRARLLGLEKIIVESTNKDYDMSQFTDSELRRIIAGEDPGKILVERSNGSNAIESKSRIRIKKKNRKKK